jgi:uncharacterized protein (DUF952 family)
MIYHIVSRADWAEAAGDLYRGDTLASEGFIHCSTAGQVADVANFRFAGREDLLLLHIDPDRLSAEVRYEDGGDGRLFPHIYGPLEKTAVVRVTEYRPGWNGKFGPP